MITSLARQFTASAAQPPPTSPLLTRVAAVEKRNLPGMFRLLLRLGFIAHA